MTSHMDEPHVPTFRQHDLARLRLASQRLVGEPFARPADVVGWLGAVQSQDYAGAKWALAQRCEGATSASLDDDFAAGRFLRTHVLRPTWHFVTPADLRGLLVLTAPRVRAASAGRSRDLGLDEATYVRSNAAIAAALRDGAQLTRPELGQALADAGIPPDGQRLPYLLMRAELDAVICSGARRGKHHTYALFDTRVPPAPAPDREVLLAGLARRYFTSHGPSTPHDFAWWSGLTIADARAGIALNGAALAREEVEGRAFWYDPQSTPPRGRTPVVHLLPNYDELTVAYRDHGPSFHPDVRGRGPGDLLANVIAVDGLVVGGWRRTLTKRAVIIDVTWCLPLEEAAEAGLAAAAERFGAFLGLPVVFHGLTTYG